MKHKNTAASGIAGAIAIVALYLLYEFAGFDPPSYVTAALTTVIVALALFIGRRGFVGLFRLFARGSS